MDEPTYGDNFDALTVPTEWSRLRLLRVPYVGSPDAPLVPVLDLTAVVRDLEQMGAYLTELATVLRGN